MRSIKPGDKVVVSVKGVKFPATVEENPIHGGVVHNGLVRIKPDSPNYTYRYVKSRMIVGRAGA